MCFDRFITLNLACHFRRAGIDASGPRLPVLMYHSISDDPEPGLASYYKVSTSPAVFRQHIGFLVEQGYCSIELVKAVELLQQGGPMPEKSVVITFDDGFRNVFTEALPVLREHGFTATVFLPTAFIGSPRRSFKDRECLTWDEVSDLQKCGINFGSHTVNHPRLMELSWKDIEIEVRQSKAELEQHLGKPISTFAHPYAFPQANLQYTQGIKKLLAESGYVCCATTAIGSMRNGDDPFRLKRLPVNSWDDLAFFRAKLEGRYDWLAWPQAMIKGFKERVRASTKWNVVAPGTNNATLNQASMS